METKNRQKILLICAGSMLALYIANSFILSPLMASWSERSKEITQLRQQLASGTNLVNHASAYRRQWGNMESNSLPSNTSVAEAQLLKSFDRWEHASGLTRVSIKPQWKDVDTDYKTLECRADYNGDIGKFTRLLYEIEKDPTGIKVDNIEISSRDDNGQQLSMGLQISGLMLNLSTNAPTQP